MREIMRATFNRSIIRKARRKKAKAENKNQLKQLHD
jgi:hypothetical protein